MSTRPRLRLGDVLAEPSLALELLTAPPDAASRDVHGAHTVEVEAPERWLARHWIMLTTGVRLHGRPRAQRELIPSLEATGVTALGFGVGLGFKHVPPPIVASAAELGFPVFAVPYETPFREIVHFVERSLTGAEEHVFRRLTALQRYLVDALRAADPERAMVDRLASFLEASVLLTGTGERPAQTAGRAPFAALQRALHDRPIGLLEVEAGAWHAVAVPVDETGRRLVVAVRCEAGTDRLIRAAAEATAPLLAAVTELDCVIRDQVQAVKGALLAEALQPEAVGDRLPLAARSAAFGLDFSSPARVAVVRPGLPPGDLAAELERAGLPHLLHPDAETLTALVQGSDAAIAEALEAVRPPGASIGLGRPISAIGNAHESRRDAELAAARGADGVVRFEHLDLGTFMLAEIPYERVAPKVDEILSVLHANPPLHEALRGYFSHDLDIAATAEGLHMHRNSLRYRLSRAEQLLGRSLKEPATIAAVFLALGAEAACTHVGRLPKAGS